MKRESLVALPAALTAPGIDGGARFVMGVDGGATKTLAAVLDLREHTLHLGHGGSSNPDAVGAPAATASLLKATDEALGRAGIDRDGLDAAVLAIAGTDTDAVAKHVRELRPVSWVVVNDVVGAWAAATGAQPGVGAISGTGSNVFGVGPDARAWRAGGWGHVLGDEGSGYRLAVDSIRAALADRERSGPETALSAAAIDFFGVDSVGQLATLVYSKPLAKGEIAAFAVETARVAHAGDAVARGLYERAAVELGRQITAVIEQTGLAGEFPVGLIGSAFKAGALFVEPLTEVVRRAAPQARVGVVEMAPVGGCLLLAARVGGGERSIDSVALKGLLDAVLAREGVFRE
jgi:N-acetylglucosamine kinase-like BadF-type ATPase